ncbi:MAG: class I SAM-dependent methyltransferase, partial [Gammaproteobacteria bacterium]|nr:class I SAM-dependent methyltransferase [Gammaproteobacteria bacterium]
MSQADRDKWDERYAAGEYFSRTWATPLIERWLPRLPGRQGGRALDVACGAGRNALFLAEAGYQVDAMDISSVAIERARASAAERGVEVGWIVADLEEAPIPEDTYDLIVVVRYLHRPLCARLMKALRDGGYLLYEQHVVSTRPVGGPRSAAFRLQPNELLALFQGLRVLEY